jgi:ketosteroid isomerase-like protein
MCVPLAIAADMPEQPFRNLETRISHAVVSRDVNEMNKLFASDYTSVGVSGQIRSRAEIIEMYSSGRLSISASKTERITVRQYGDTAIVVGFVTVSGKEGDEDISGQYAFTRVYRRISGAWQAVTFEATLVK